MSAESLDTDGTHAVPLGVQLTIGALVSVIGCASTWWTVHNSTPSDAKGDSEPRRRGHLLQLRLYQTAVLATNAIYLACVILSCWNSSGVGLDVNQIIGIFAWLLTVATGFWLTVSTYVPYFEDYVLRHRAVLSVLSTSTQACATTISVICGVLAPSQGQDSMLLMAFQIMLGNQSAAVAVPQCLCHALGVMAWSCSTQSSPVVQQVLLRTAGVASVGIVLPAVQGLVLPNQSSKAPSSVFAVTLAVTELYRLLDQLLRTRRIARALADGPAMRIVLQPLAGEHLAFSLKQPYVTVALLVLYLLHILVSFVGPLVHTSGGKPPQWLLLARQNSILQPVCTYVEALPTAKQQAVAFVAVVLVLQVLSSVSLAVCLPIYGLARFIQAAPVVLLGVMMGFVVQACTIMYLVITAPPASSSPPVDSTTTQDARRQRAKSLDHKRAIAMEADMSFDKANMIKKMGLNSYLESMPDKAPQQDTTQSRISALANFQAAVQSLESQGMCLEQEDFIRASRGVIRAVFPGVFQSSISYVTASYHSVDVFTVVGVGSNLPPRLNMPVAPGTLLKYVLETGNPLFMPSTQDFVGPFSDVQFLAMALRLQSLAVLPLLYQGAELVGVLLLGYDVPSTWSEQDTALARQLSVVLAHASTLMDGDSGYDATPRQWHNMRPGGPAAGGYGSNSTIPASWYRPGSAAQMQAAAGTPSYGRGSISQWEPDDLREAGGPGRGMHRPGGDEEDDASNVQLEGALRDLKVLEIIGRGGFGSVYKGIWRSQVVAVKVLEHGDDLVGCSDDPLSSGGSGDNGDNNSRKAALLEGAVTSALDHPAIVRTFDYHVISVAQSKDKDGSVRRSMQQTQIVMEFCDRGCLQDAIDQGVFYSGGSRRPGGAAPAPDTTAAANVAVDMEALLMTLGEVAGALQYLHTHCITHRDLKPKNILLKTSTKDRRGFSAKVSDFGLSQVQRADEGTHVSSKYSGTITHMPPELIEDGKVYPMGDVYAFGIIMWEIYTGASPYSNMTRPQIMVGVVTHNLRPKFPESCPDWYKQLAYRCWRKDPRQRPSFGDVAAEVQELLLTRAKPDARGR